MEKKHGTYFLKAGTAQGVALDSEFTIHAAHTGVSLANPPLCRMRVKEVHPFRSTLEPIVNMTTIKIPIPAYAREVLSGSGQELRVHFSEAFKRVVSVWDIQQVAQSTNEPNFGFIVSDANSAEILVDIEDTTDSDSVTFSTTELLATQHQYRKLPKKVAANAEDICRVLRAAARWNYHFKRTSHAHFSELVEVEFYRLERHEGEYDEEGMLILTPADPPENMNRTGVVDLVVKEDDYYGVKIVNKCKIDLYPYLFYFDLSDQSIGQCHELHLAVLSCSQGLMMNSEPYYLSQRGKNRVDPPLRAGSFHTVGYGTGGEVPFAFHLRSGENLDIGFLKLFVTTSPTDFDSLNQPSPFEIARGTISKTDTVRKLKQLSEGTEQWGTVLTAIIQRSHPRNAEVFPNVPSKTSAAQQASSSPSKLSSGPPGTSSASSDAPPMPSNPSSTSPKSLTIPLKNSASPPTTAASPPPSRGWFTPISDCLRCSS